MKEYYKEHEAENNSLAGTQEANEVVRDNQSPFGKPGT